jgi:hypothetical protein
MNRGRIMSTRISEIADALAQRVQDGRLALGPEAEDLLEILDTLVLYPGGRLDLSAVVIRREDASLTVTGTSQGSWQVPAMPRFAISEVSVTLTLTVNADTGAVTTTASLRGAVTTTAGTWRMTAASDQGELWRVSLELGDISVADIMALVPGFDAEAFLPGPLWSIATGVRLSRFELTFDPHEGSRTGVSLAVAVPGAWDLLPGKLTVRDTTLALTLVLDTLTELQIDGEVHGTAVLGGHAHVVDVGLGSTHGFTLALAASHEDPPVRLAEVGALLGVGEAIAPLEESLEALGFRGLRLTRLGFGLDLRSLQVLRAEIEVETVLRGFNLRGSLEYPDLELRGGLADGSVLDAKQLLTAFEVPAQELPELRVTDFAVLLRPAARAASVHASLTGDWALRVGNTALALDRVDLGLNVNPGAVRAEITAWALVAGVVCSVAVTLPALTVAVSLLPGASLEVRGAGPGHDAPGRRGTRGGTRARRPSIRPRGAAAGRDLHPRRRHERHVAPAVRTGAGAGQASAGAGGQQAGRAGRAVGVAGGHAGSRGRRADRHPEARAGGRQPVPRARRGADRVDGRHRRIRAGRGRVAGGDRRARAAPAARAVRQRRSRDPAIQVQG